MLTVYFSVVAVGLGAAVAIGVPLFESHRRARALLEQTLSAELSRQRAIIADYEATIEAYRLYAQSDPELAGSSL